MFLNTQGSKFTGSKVLPAVLFQVKSRDFTADLGPEHTTGTYCPGHAITPHSVNKCWFRHPGLDSLCA